MKKDALFAHGLALLGTPGGPGSAAAQQHQSPAPPTNPTSEPTKSRSILGRCNGCTASRPVELQEFTNNLSQTRTTGFYLHIVKRNGAAPTRQPVAASAATGVCLLQYVPATGQPLVQRVVVE